MEISAPTPTPTPPPPPTLATVAPSPSQPVELPPDDLKEIVGIGPILEHTLQSLGLRTFAQIATITPEDIAMLIVKVDSSIAERVLRERWVEQARELYAKKYGKAAA
jgi:predicted flap endonuclease-1-like 5' DNA nuclease